MRLKTTMIYVTHDQVEAMTMADKIVGGGLGLRVRKWARRSSYQPAKRPSSSPASSAL